MKTKFMKIVSRPITALFCVGAVLLFGTATLRADDDTKTPHRQRKVASKAHTPVLTVDDRNAQEVQGGVTGGATGPEHRVRTGSHIPEHYNRRGYTTDSRDNETIYDHNDIRLQNSNTVSESLRQIPGVNVGGRP